MVLLMVGGAEDVITRHAEYGDHHDGGDMQVDFHAREIQALSRTKGNVSIQSWTIILIFSDSKLEQN